MTRRRGFTLIELLVYLAGSGIILLAATTFVVRMMSLRAVAATGTRLQENARVALDTMTVSIRNAYQVDVAGAKITVYSHPADHPANTIYTIYQVQGSELVTGSGSDPDTVSMNPMLDTGVDVQGFQATAISSAVEVQMTLHAATQTFSTESTMAYRQAHS